MAVRFLGVCHSTTIIIIKCDGSIQVWNYFQRAQEILVRNCFFSCFWSCYIFNLHGWVYNAGLFDTFSDNCRSTEGKHWTRCWFPRISIPLEIWISVPKYFQVFTWTYQHIVPSFSQIFENMLHRNQVFKAWVGLKPTHNSYFIADVWSGAQYCVHQTSNYWCIWYTSHILFFLRCHWTLLLTILYWELCEYLINISCLWESERFTFLIPKDLDS